SQGPGEFWGLPGLILEASYDETTILCSKVVLNPKTKNEIKKPKKGKKVTKKEYESLIEKQMEQMTDENGAIRIDITK
ncbi:MAG: GLPGLI family protein, partial [Flavobacterium sp.]